MKQIRIGMLGFGTVGTGVVKGLQENGDILGKRLGVRPVITMIADLDLDRNRGVNTGDAVLVRDAVSVIESRETDIIVELVGGTDDARHLVMKALENGKPVVTANKALLASYGGEILGMAAAKNVDIYFSASVGGGIPVIRSIREGLIANRIDRIYGIVNGTCNYILTQMEEEGLSFDRALAEAQAKGYAEANPGLDIDGFDTAHKAVILASLACGQVVPMSAVQVEGINGLSECDMRTALDIGYRIKLLAVIKTDIADAGTIMEVLVYPALVPLDHKLASVGGVFNAVMVHGDLTGDTMYYGKGAGQEPTAASVIADIADIARNIVNKSPCRVPALPQWGGNVVIRDKNEIETRCYLRFTLENDNMKEKVLLVLAKHGVKSAQSFVDNNGDLIVLTDMAKESCFHDALKEVDSAKLVKRSPVRFRILE